MHPLDFRITLIFSWGSGFTGFGGLPPKYKAITFSAIESYEIKTRRMLYGDFSQERFKTESIDKNNYLKSVTEPLKSKY